MKTISSGLKSLLMDSEYLIRAELLTITLQEGAGVYRYISADRDLNYNGYTWLSGDGGVNPGWKRGKVATSLGTDAKIMDLTFMCSPISKIGGVLVPTFANFGGFDNAIIEVDALPMASWGQTTNGTYNLWTGIAGNVTVDRTHVDMQVSSYPRILQGAFPRNYTLPTCNNTLYDAACTLNKASYAVNGTVASGSWTTASFNSNLTQANDYFDLGWIVWTSGQNSNLMRTVKLYENSGGAMTMVYPLPYVPSAGDTFTAYPGCDKTQTTCNSKFNNQAHYRGFPYMPNPMVLFAGASTSTTAGPGGAGGDAGRTPGGGGTSMKLE